MTNELGVRCKLRIYSHSEVLANPGNISVDFSSFNFSLFPMFTGVLCILLVFVRFIYLFKMSSEIEQQIHPCLQQNNQIEKTS